MILRPSPTQDEIIELLSRLKATTPEYPADMLAARKAVFLKQATTIQIQSKGQGGDSGHQGGSSGSSLGGSTSASGISFQAVIGFGLVALMLLGAFLVQQVSSPNNENIMAALEESPEVAMVPQSNNATPTLIPTQSLPTVATPEITVTVVVSTPTPGGVINNVTVGNGTPEVAKTNPGLKLGTTPGTPAAPGQGNPGNINQPDKPEKPEKPEKGKPEK
jgi:hypothetical protein